MGRSMTQTEKRALARTLARDTDLATPQSRVKARNQANTRRFVSALSDVLVDRLCTLRRPGDVPDADDASMSQLPHNPYTARSALQ